MNATAVFADWDDARLVDAARGAQPHAFGELFERWYDRCYDVAWGVCRDREAAADVAQEAFCACWERLAELRDPAAFGGWVLRASRNHALNRLERERIRRHDSIDAEEPMAIPDPGAGPDAQVEQDENRRLVWAAASVLGQRDTSLLDLHLRHGLGASEIAEELSITPNNASQLLHRLRGQLRDTIGAVLLWRRGRPACRSLARLVGARDDFDAEVSALIRRHRRLCAECTVEVTERQPELLFASIPMAIAAVALKDQARAALAQAGVPVFGPAGTMPLSAAPQTPPDGGAVGATGATSGAVQTLPFTGKALLPALVGAVAVAGVLGALGSGLMPGRAAPHAAQDAAGLPAAGAPPAVVAPAPTPGPTIAVALVAGADGVPSTVAPRPSPAAVPDALTLVVPSGAAAGAVAGLPPRPRSSAGASTTSGAKARPAQPAGSAAGPGTSGGSGGTQGSVGTGGSQPGVNSGPSTGGSGGQSTASQCSGRGIAIRLVRFGDRRGFVVVVGGCRVVTGWRFFPWR